MNLHRRLLQSGENATAALVAAVALGLAGALLAIVQAALLARAIAGAFLGGDTLDTLGVVLGLLSGVLVARALLGWAAEVVAQRISAAVKASLRRRVLAAALELGPRRMADHSTASLALLATRGLDALDGYFARYVPQVVLAAIVPVAVVVCLLAVDVVAALTVALTVPLIPVFMVLIGRISAARRDRRWATMSRLARRFADVVAGLPTLRAYGRADAQVDILRATTDAYRAATLDTLRVAFLSAMVLELLSTISVALVAVGVGLRLVEGSLGLQTGLFALILAPEAYLPLRRLGAEFHASEEGIAAARQAFALIDEADGAESRGVAETGPSGTSDAMVRSLRGPIVALRVEDVSVAQPGREAVAPAHASLVARPGELVALTGESGAGKSTLLSAILGFVAPSAGRIVIELTEGSELDLTQVDPEAWRARVAWVPQVPYLFPGTVSENVRLGRPEASDDEVASALAAAALDPASGDRTVGEGGRGLSGGERRRVGLARALVRRADVLLLDEPTAGLDPEGERRVMRAIRKEAGRGVLVLVVAHRPGAVAEADRSIGIGWAAVEGDAELAPPDMPAVHALGEGGAAPA